MSDIGRNNTYPTVLLAVGKTVRALQLLSPFRAHWRPVPYLRALPGVVLYLPFRQYLVIIDLCPPLIINPILI
jgi:hypothetical protein